MTEQPLDVRGFVRMVRRRRWIVVAACLVGLTGALLHASVRSPLPAAEAIVLLPRAPTGAGGESSRDMRTEVVVAASSSVLDVAGRELDPVERAESLRDRVTVTALSHDVLSFVARARTSADAIRLANAVADGYVAQETTSGDPGTRAALRGLQARAEQLVERIADLEDELALATSAPATGVPSMPGLERLGSLRNDLAAIGVDLETVTSQIAALREEDGRTSGAPARVLQRAVDTLPASSTRVPVAGAIGLFGGLVVGVVGAAAIDRRDRRLRLRDEIAVAVGAPVVASVTSHRCRSVDDCTDLLDRYEPDLGDRWALRRTIQQLGGGSVAGTDLAVLVIPGDEGALAVAAQLATVAADLSIDTLLVVDSGESSVLNLRGACRIAGPRRPHLAVSHAAPAALARPPTLVVRVVPIGAPPGDEAGGLRGHPRQSLLAVSSGFATAEQLVRGALAAADSGAPVTGVLVADPDPADRTTGHVPCWTAPPGDADRLTQGAPLS